MIIIVDIIAEA